MWKRRDDSLIFISFLLIAFAVACSTTMQQIKPSAPGEISPIVAAPALSVPPWENVSQYPKIAKAANSAWSSQVRGIVNEQFTSFDSAKDASRFCPKYAALSHDQKVEAWLWLVTGISFYESSWSPSNGMVETTMGVDPTTGAPVQSSGLLQLSYQDGPNYQKKVPVCAKLDFHLKNITDPTLNLDCGVRILAYLINRSAAVTSLTGVTGGGNYWSVLRPGHHPNDIAALVAKLPFCQ